MKPDRIDPGSPIPLYHQIAESIRARIRAGDLGPGDALVPLREAAERYGVNLHTVRHAYTALAREGLVASEGARGTRVVGTPRPGPRADEGAAFVRRVLDEARLRLGWSAEVLVDAIEAVASSRGALRPVIHVIECSEWQCVAHAGEIMSRGDVDARPWSLERAGEPPAGPLVATYFHYNDVRRRWPARLDEVRFVTIRPDPTLRDAIPPGTRTVRVLERDRTTAENVAADVSVALHGLDLDVEPVFGDDPVALLRTRSRSVTTLVAPRVWASLSPRQRARSRVLEARYVLDPADLEALVAELVHPRVASI